MLAQPVRQSATSALTRPDGTRLPGVWFFLSPPVFCPRGGDGGGAGASYGVIAGCAVSVSRLGVLFCCVFATGGKTGCVCGTGRLSLVDSVPMCGTGLWRASGGHWSGVDETDEARVPRSSTEAACGVEPMLASASFTCSGFLPSCQPLRAPRMAAVMGCANKE